MMHVCNEQSHKSKQLLMQQLSCLWFSHLVSEPRRSSLKCGKPKFGMPRFGMPNSGLPKFVSRQTCCVGQAAEGAGADLLQLDIPALQDLCAQAKPVDIAEDKQATWVKMTHTWQSRAMRIPGQLDSATCNAGICSSNSCVML